MLVYYDVVNGICKCACTMHGRMDYWVLSAGIVRGAAVWGVVVHIAG